MTVRRLTGSKRAITTTISVIAFLVLALPATASAVTTTWDGSVDTDWNTDANWDTNAQPTAADTAVINNTSTNNPVVSTADEAASAVVLSGSKTLTVATTGELDVGGQITAPVGTNVSLTGGHLQFGTLLIDNAAGLTLTSGAIAGTLNATAPVTVTNAGVTYGTSVSTSDGFTLGSNANITQTATINMSDSHFLNIANQLYTLDGASINETAASTPTITIGNTGTLTHDGGNNLVRPQINSDGTIRTTDTFGSLTLLSNGGGNANQIGGELETVGDSWLFLSSAGAGDTYTVKSGGLTVNNPGGRVEVIGNTGSNFILNNQTVRLNGDFMWDGSGGGLFSGTGTFDAVSPNFGEFLIDDGDFADNANVTITSDTTARVVGSSDWTNTSTFNVNGLLRLDGTNLTAPGPDDPQINISSSGQLDHVGANGLVEPRVVSNNGTIEDQNSSGTLNLERTGEPGQTNLYSGTMRTTGSGDLRLGTQVHRLQGALTMDTSQGGVIRTGGSADLQLNGQTLTLVGNSLDHESGVISGTGTINGPGLLRVEGGDFAGGGALTVNAPTQQTSVTDVAGAGSELLIGGDWTSNNDITFSGTGGTHITVTSSGILRHNGGPASTVFAPLVVSGIVSQDGGSDWDLSGGTTLNSSALVNVTTNQLDIDPLTNLSGGGTLNSNGTYVVNGGTLRFPNDITTLNADMHINGGAEVRETGANTLALDNLSTIGSTGRLNFDGGHTEDVAANLQVNGTLSGDGTLIGNVNNNGVVSPGQSVGEFFIVGNYNQTSNGQLPIEVAGVDPNEFDVLDVDGDVAFDGELALQPIDGFASSASPGDRAPFLRYTGGRSGEFATTTVNPPLSNDKPFTADYVDAGLRVDAVVGDEPPDTQAPAVTITKKKISQEKRDAKFKFTANEAGTTFECKLDKRPWRACSSPRNYGNLDLGKHKFRLRGTDPSGNVSAVAKKKFKIRDV